jgi:hypothetical protein
MYGLFNNGRGYNNCACDLNIHLSTVHIYYEPASLMMPPSFLKTGDGNLNYQNCCVSHGGLHAWPQRSCYLNPLYCPSMGPWGGTSQLQRATNRNRMLQRTVGNISNNLHTSKNVTTSIPLCWDAHSRHSEQLLQHSSLLTFIYVLKWY